MENKTDQHPTVEQLLEQAEFELAVARQQLIGTQELLTQAMGEIARQEVLLAKSEAANKQLLEAIQQLQSPPTIEEKEIEEKVEE
ncbi:hypothetical protein H1_14 [Efunavirus H1]|uniref:Uncharacterized protein n=1 Tax=Enterococcus phage H1 TaxID=2982918 RepID=A0AAE9P6P9_9CAUD|nr:hypothetical protein H1_14 [Enterococcus phage H1]